MPVRLRLRLKSKTGEMERIAVINTGFISESPEIALPVKIAEQLGLWPAPTDALSVTLETGGGEVETYIVPHALEVEVVVPDRRGRKVVANAVINPHINDILVSDSLTEELGIQILYPRKGLWRFADEQVTRESAQE